MRKYRQLLLKEWATKEFGEIETNNAIQRGIRLLEEALEAYQAVGGSADMAHILTNYVFSRPVGDIRQEIGGVSVALLLLAEAANLDADTEEICEIERIIQKTPEGNFRKRNAEKNAAGFKAEGI